MNFAGVTATGRRLQPRLVATVPSSLQLQLARKLRPHLPPLQHLPRHLPPRLQHQRLPPRQLRPLPRRLLLLQRLRAKR